MLGSADASAVTVLSDGRIVVVVPAVRRSDYTTDIGHIDVLSLDGRFDGSHRRSHSGATFLRISILSIERGVTLRMTREVRDVRTLAARM